MKFMYAPAAIVAYCQCFRLNSLLFSDSVLVSWIGWNVPDFTKMITSIFASSYA
ncbi:hypothetical protein PsorP6_002249 [Peronosclerospora sorghi]|uniref:Uncharacterized protein n=1 Tax=Peronosclerospora sorghi TaxID=230839 RepID=A0ACC0WVU9_9STRA|nr:hypothetical protein PsorP6_002249 [Peronosclerospora sorghi]